MVRVRVRGWIIHVAYKSPKKDRSTMMCVCVCAHADLVLCHSGSAVELWVMTRSGCGSIFNATGCSVFKFRNCAQLAEFNY